MTADFAKLVQEPLGSVVTTLGDLCIFGITMGGQSRLRKELRAPIGDSEPMTLARALARQVCCRPAALVDAKYKPTMPSLVDEELTLLTSEDLEAFAEAYISMNAYLAKMDKQTDQPGQAARERVSDENAEVTYPRAEDETATHHLRRLFDLQEKRIGQAIGRSLGGLTGLSSFSPALAEQIRRTVTLGDSLAQTMQNLRSEHEVFQVPQIPDLSSRTHELARLVAKGQARPVREVTGRLDELIDGMARTADFLVATNNIQAGIASELKSAGDATRNSSRLNTWLTATVIALTVTSMGVSIYALYRSNGNAALQRDQTAIYVDRVVTALGAIKTSLVAPSDSLATENRHLARQVEGQGREISSLKQEVLHQRAQLDDLLAKPVKKED